MSLTKTHNDIGHKIKKSYNQTAYICDTLLSTLNNNHRWGLNTNTSKMLNTMGGRDCLRDQPMMTEDDVDRLFQRANSRDEPKDTAIRGDIRLQHAKDIRQTSHTLLSTKKKMMTDVCERVTWADEEKKNFVHGVKFLRMDDPQDKFMTGVDRKFMEESEIDQLFQKFEQQKDYTTEFKQNYLVGKIVGQGAYASVRVAIHKPTNKKIAIKIYEKNKINDPQRKKSIRRQITILSQLSHPNIVKLLNVVQSNNHLNLIMEYIPGKSLSTFLKEQPKGKIGEKICKDIFLDLAKALRYMHQINIAHRDIKLENVILGDQLRPKIIDFGFSTCIHKGQVLKIFCGTPSYMAPEVVQRREHRGEAADVWALGVMLFVCLTGIFPFKGATDQQLYKKINSSDYPKSQLFFSRQISDLMSKMLRVDPQLRITTNQVHLLQHSQQSILGLPNNQQQLVRKKQKNVRTHARESIHRIQHQ